MLAAFIVGVILAAFLAPLLLRKVRAQEVDQEVEQRLLRMCLGDKSQVERLVRAEMQRRPKMTRADAAARVLTSMVRDGR